VLKHKYSCTDSYIAKYYQHSSYAIFKNSVDVFLYMHMYIRMVYQSQGHTWFLDTTFMWTSVSACLITTHMERSIGVAVLAGALQFIL